MLTQKITWKESSLESGELSKPRGGKFWLKLCPSFAQIQ